MVVHRNDNFDFHALFHPLWAVPSCKVPLESTKRHQNQRFFGWYAACCSTINKWQQIVSIKGDRDVLHSGAGHGDKYARRATCTNKGEHENGIDRLVDM
jgi:hypothetical protein